MPNFTGMFLRLPMSAASGHYSFFTSRSRRQKPALIKPPWQRCGSGISSLVGADLREGTKKIAAKMKAEAKG
jgi:hypothetical protein